MKMDEFVNKEYSPSQWSTRFSPSKVVEVHGDVLKQCK